MPRRRRSRALTSSEQSATSELAETSNILEDLPDVGFSKINGKDAKDKRRVSFSFALAADPNVSGALPLTEEPASIPPPLPQRPRIKTKAELKEIVDLTPEDNVAILELKANKKGATKKQPSSKRDAAAEREARKAAREDERRAKREWEEINNMYKPGECLKHMSISMSPQLYQEWYMEDVKREVIALGTRVIALPELEGDVLVWSRDEPRTLVNVGGQLKLSTVPRPCGRKLYIFPAEGINSSAAARLSGPHLRGNTVALFQLDVLRKSTQKNTMQRPMIDPAKSISDLQLELQVSHDAELVLAETSQELAMLVVRYTRAYADLPYKKAKREIDEQAEFYMRGDNKNCVAVDKDGNGLTRLWEQMLATLPQSSLEVARSLGSEYRSPKALLLELMSSGGMTRIAELGVSRTNVPGSKTRRLGPEFTRKLHTLFTSEDGNKIID